MEGLKIGDIPRPKLTRRISHGSVHIHRRHGQPQAIHGIRVGLEVGHWGDTPSGVPTPTPKGRESQDVRYLELFGLKTKKKIENISAVDGNVSGFLHEGT